MSRWGYLGVLLVVLASVGFGLDWQSATLSPMPIPKSTIPAAVPGNKSEVPATAFAPLGNQSPAAVVPLPEQTVGAQQPSRPVVAGTTNAVAPNCNVQACAAAYRSFLAADCSYQPINGPRRRCEKK